MIVNITRNTTVASHIKIAKNPLERMQGLLGRTHFSQGEALVITHCHSIHMLFMQFSIDVIFCDSQHKVVGLCTDIKPFQLSPVFLKSSYAIELPTGSIAASQTQVGDVIKM